MARVTCVNACDHCPSDGIIEKPYFNEEGWHWRETVCRHCGGRECIVCALGLWEYTDLDCCEVDWH